MRPDIDVEICPPGTMALLESLKWCPVCEESAKMNHLPGCKFGAILAAHRAQLDPGPTIKQSLTVQSTCKPSLQVDYTSETEDLSTWPQTRGPEWRRMQKGETIQLGDVGKCAHRNSSRGYFAYASGWVGTKIEYRGSPVEAYTRRPAPEAQT